MTFFKKDEFVFKYPNYQLDEDWKIEAVSEMIYSQVGLRYRNPNWTSDTVPTAIKNASMEQLRFMLEYDIPFIDYKSKVKAGEMESELSSDYSTLALRYLANGGYLYRGNTLNQNRSLNMPFGTN
ncbi:MAG: hypothetical protein IKE89_03400 [Bacilli bacterium]|nr:hypothetical protein [Bacilli bacterium]MBR2711497.1 hypothetical protein [Bacilli bacterium]